MSFPTNSKAEELLTEASLLNPGDWVQHNRVAGNCARIIASRYEGMNEQRAYVLGLLHDIGRRFGVNDLKHTICGYSFMLEQGYSDCAKICLTHSFPYKDIECYNGENDCTEEESLFLQKYLKNTEYDDYDKLIQLCDAISYTTGPCHIEKRLVDVVMRRGFNELTVLKWTEFFTIKRYFEMKTNSNLYELFDKLIY